MSTPSATDRLTLLAAVLREAAEMARQNWAAPTTPAQDRADAPTADGGTMTEAANAPHP